MTRLHHYCAALVLAASLTPARPADAPPVHIRVQVNQPGDAPARVGVFFEDINYAADGGLYPERVKNRSFEFTEPLMGWKPVAGGGPTGTVTVLDAQPLNTANPHYVRLANATATNVCALVNEGFFGIGLEQGAAFTWSAYARSPAESTQLTVELVSAQGQVLARQVLRGFTPAWQKHGCTLRSATTDPKAILRLTLIGAGSLDLDMISLFPKETWNDRPNGLRPDLVQWLAELKPAFVRFPGGCIVEGRHLSTRYQWKTTLGDLSARKLIVNRWNDEFQHRPAPDYFQSFGLGFFECFQLCEDLGADALPILNCGMACQFNSGELAPLDQLDPYIQDALDLVEFARGPASSPWGARRAALGHPKPFPLRWLGVGNEQWGPQYLERYTRFAQVLKARYPDLQLVSSAGPRPNDELYHYLWPKLRELKADIVDEHCYDRPAWFLDNARRYDDFPRQGPRVFMGEYAAQSIKVVSPENRNNWECALAEAAYLTGLERNSAVVQLSSYAPLFAHEEGWQWRPNLIWFDNLRSYATPSYYVQQLFSRHRGDAILPVTVEGQPAPTSQAPGLYASASSQKNEVILKVVNSAAERRRATLHLAGARRVGSQATVILLKSARLTDENSLDAPVTIAPIKETLRDTRATFDYVFPAYSVTVLRIPASPLRPRS